MAGTRCFLCLMLFFAMPVAARTTVTSAEAVDSYIRSELQRQHIPGLSLLVARNGVIVRAQGYGLANVELDVPVRPETVFQSGSVGKQFTATAVMMLVEEGKIGLDDPITKYLNDPPASWREVTVRQLLSHTAGFTDYPNDFDFRKDYTEAQMLKMVEAIPLAFPPGTKWSYSNLGYLTLGIVIHQVAGKFYGNFLQERIFQPLGMTTTRVISEADIVPNRAAGYRLVKGEAEEPGMGRANAQYDRGRRALFFDSRLGEVGCCVIHRKAAEALEPLSDVDGDKAQEWRTEPRALRIRLGHP